MGNIMRGIFTIGGVDIEYRSWELRIYVPLPFAVHNWDQQVLIFYLIYQSDSEIRGCPLNVTLNTELLLQKSEVILSTKLVVYPASCCFLSNAACQEDVCAPWWSTITVGRWTPAVRALIGNWLPVLHFVLRSVLWVMWLLGVLQTILGLALLVLSGIIMISLGIAGSWILDSI